MNDKIAKGMIEKMVVVDTKSTYASLKSKEAELLAQLKELQDEIKIAETDVITEKLNTALQCLVDVDKMTNGGYNITVEKYCGACSEYIDVNFALSEIIEMLQFIN